MPDDGPGLRSLSRVLADIVMAQSRRKAVVGTKELRVHRMARTLAHDAADNGLAGDEFDEVLNFTREQFRARTTEIAERRDRESKE